MIPPHIVKVKVTDIPEALSAMRVEMANILRQGALDEHPDVAKRLRAIAAQFETGVVDAN